MNTTLVVVVLELATHKKTKMKSYARHPNFKACNKKKLR
jgi:hypothetical protein